MLQGRAFEDASTSRTGSGSGNSVMAVTGDIWRLVPLVVAMAYASPTAADDRAASLRPTAIRRSTARSTTARTSPGR